MPKYVFNPGDEVRIRASTKYNNCWEGCSGVVTGDPYTPLSGEVAYPVRFNTVTGVTGRFWYREADLEPATLIVECGNLSPWPDYSDILGKSPAELGVSKEMLLLCEADERNRWKKEMKEKMMFAPDSITNVIFNAPATIVFWADGTKTVVKCGFEDIYDPEVGLAMAISKKMFGNDNTFHKVFKKWLPEPEATDGERGEEPCLDDKEKE